MKERMENGREETQIHCQRYKRQDMEYSQPSAIHTLSDVSKPDHIQERDTAAVETAQN